MKVVVTGGTGFIGRRVVETLLERGDGVTVITRDASKLPSTFHGLVETQSWEELDFSGQDAVVHLAGENILAHRWSDEHKKRLMDSRVETTQKIVAAIEQASPRPAVFACASAIGAYGSRGNEDLDETSALGEGFLAEVAQAWETEASKAEGLGVRCAQIRIGVVLGDDGGALERMIPPFRSYIGGTIGGGKQWVSWIHVRDVARLIAFVLDEEQAKGPINAVADQPVQMKQLCKALGKALSRPSWLPVPGFVLSMLLGEGAQVIRNSIKVHPKRAKELGFDYEFATLDAALEECVTEVIVP
jgi:uncharacterized protein (TIGR01777 family)